MIFIVGFLRKKKPPPVYQKYFFPRMVAPPTHKMCLDYFVKFSHMIFLASTFPASFLERWWPSLCLGFVCVGMCYVFSFSANGFCNLGQIIFGGTLGFAPLCFLFFPRTILEAINVDVAHARE